MSEQHPDGETVLSVEGSFDPMTAHELHARLSAARCAAPVVLDFHKVVEVHDLGIAVLAHGLARDGIPVRFRGLSQHHERILRYLGFDAARERASSPGGTVQRPW